MNGWVELGERNKVAVCGWESKTTPQMLALGGLLLRDDNVYMETLANYTTYLAAILTVWSMF